MVEYIKKENQKALQKVVADVKTGKVTSLTIQKHSDAYNIQYYLGEEETSDERYFKILKELDELDFSDKILDYYLCFNKTISDIILNVSYKNSKEVTLEESSSSEISIEDMIEKLRDKAHEKEIKKLTHKQGKRNINLDIDVVFDNLKLLLK